jgi:NADH-quinone oxidoreductase subunit L
MSKLLGFLPFISIFGAFLAISLGHVSRSKSGLVATLFQAIGFLVAVVLFNNMPPSGVQWVELFQWFSLGGLSVDWKFIFDRISAPMVLLITGASTLIHLFSIGYMKDEQSSPRYFCYLGGFVSMMLVLVLASSLPVLFVGWEGVGVFSFLLISFWYEDPASTAAAKKAFVMNRIGDAFLLMSMAIVFYFTRCLDFAGIDEVLKSVTLSPELRQGPLLECAAVLLFLGAAGKSAQFPLLTWLPDAMVGPTPVSALIHAATMVTGGVYLLLRFIPLYTLCPIASVIVLTLAVVTAVIGALSALFQNDIKKVLAYSTVSQLGFMFVGVISGAAWTGLFHLLTHGFFKACLFLCAGSIIHACGGQQDIRKMGGLLAKMPFTALGLIVATCAICGIFPFAGYFSKHAIVDSMKHFSVPEASIALTLGFVSVQGLVATVSVVLTCASVVTAMYMGRMLYLSLFGEYRGNAHPHEGSVSVIIPILTLGALSCVGGMVLHTMLPLWFLGGNGVSVGMTPHTVEISISEALLHSWSGILGLLLGVVSALMPESLLSKCSPRAFPVASFFQRAFCLNELYNFCLVKPFEAVSRLLWQKVDNGFIDATITGTAAMVEITGEMARSTQSGDLRTYTLGIFLSTVFFVIFYFVL